MDGSGRDGNLPKDSASGSLMDPLKVYGIVQLTLTILFMVYTFGFVIPDSKQSPATPWVQRSWAAWAVVIVVMSLCGPVFFDVFDLVN